MWRHDACDRDEFLWTIAAARVVLGADMHLQAPPNLSDTHELGALVAAGIDDWGGVSPVTPDHVNPERPWPALDACCASPPRQWARRSRRGSPCTPSTSATPSAGSTQRCGSPCSARPTPRDWRATTTGRPAVTCRRRPFSRSLPLRHARARPSARCSRACSRARKSASTRSSRCSRRAGRSSTGSPRSPTSSAATSWATSSPSCGRATSTTRTSAPSSAGSARSRKDRSHSTCAAIRTCSISRRSNGASSRRSTAVPPRCACKAVSIPASTATTTSPWRVP